MSKKSVRVGVTIQNGADPERFSGLIGHGDRVALKIPPDALVLGFVGTLTGWYVEGLYYLSQAIAIYNQTSGSTKIYLVAYGDGDGREAFLKSYSDSQWHIFPGQIPPEEVPRTLEMFNVGTVLLSDIHQMHRWGYSPLKFWEYLAAGLPVLTFQDSNMGEIIMRNHLGFVISLDEKEKDFPKKILDVLKEIACKYSNGTLSEMGRQNRAFVHNNHTWRHAAEQVAKNFPVK
jgi:glycosyltransferase involved in cell wall biosynthesis